MKPAGEEATPLTLKVTPCANGETYEYRLLVGREQIGSSVFLLGKNGAHEALRRIVGGAA